MPKEFKTIDEQLDILKSRGLIIPENLLDDARVFLKKNNYYRISGYSLTLRNHDEFYPNTSFRNLMDIYNFDREFRNILLWAIEIIEVNFKSRYAYFFTEQYGGLGHLDPRHFTNQEIYNLIISRANHSIEKRLPQEAFLQHFVKDLKEPIPLWAYVDLLTIADISLLYSVSDEFIKKKIAEEYGLKHNRASTVLGNYLHGITIVRNLCAHDSRLYNRLFITKPDLNKRELALLNKDKNGNPNNSKLYGYVLIIKRLLSKEEFSVFKSRLISICSEYPFVQMSYYGFGDGWKDAL